MTNTDLHNNNARGPKENSPRANVAEAPPLPAGQVPVNPDVQTNPPAVPPPLTSSTGTGFDAPDAGTGLPDDNFDATVGNPGPMVSSALPDPPLRPGNVDRDAQAGQAKGAESQAGAETVQSTGPVSD